MARAKTTQTKLANGVLKFEANDGGHVSGNSGLFYSATTYTKTGGSRVDIILKLQTSEIIKAGPKKSVSKGQTVGHSFGGLSKARYAPDCRVSGLMNASNGGPYWTPSVKFC
ncbi:hypothetical protein [Streptomyces sp. MUM 178J]|uniref:hypothetical protein n=1 Tax=Streptomyces sp. MUM 178J TaxID=2791991 RepID=UPI001F036524|nr:hypothetical protein [Streptomyces sp. MUM 178J]WRQ78916.1 hypothetical protein I3F59_005715 [Streptomyces sp. MUM 178J]